ncbi:MAG TPA: protein kinase [Ktedonobacteraceae bacterium]|nr:protein kinase [Ktedonobacteraceae bacterium]
MAELAGVMVGNYFLLECLGRAGMMETYRARPTMRGGFDVVLRIYRPGFPDPTNFQEHFAAEVEKVWRCHHEHIQPLIEYGAGDDLLYSVTQLTEAETLEQYLKRWEEEEHDSTLPLPLVAHFFTQLGAALQYTHEQHIVHGNIQLSSIIVENEAHILLTNFSMKHIHQDNDGVVAQVQEGNAAYIAPEQVVGMLSPACDIYALGVLLFRLLTGHLPYDGESAGEIALKHANEAIPSLRNWRPGISEEVEMVVRVALAKSPAARFPTVAAFVDALLAAIGGDKPPVVVGTSPTPTRRIPVRTRRVMTSWSRVFTLLSVLVMLSGLVGIMLFFAASPFHLDNLSFMPLQNLGRSGVLHVNPFTAPTPTIIPTPLATATPRHATATGNPPVARGQVTPTSEVTPSPTVYANGPPGAKNTTTPTPVACAAGTLSIDGSPYLEAALQQINADYNARCSGLRIGLRGDGSRALNMLQRGRLDIADADLSAQAARNLTDHPLTAQLYTLIASPDISLNGLSSAQIRGIFQGQITSWAQLGGPNEAIRIVLPPSNAAISAIFDAFVLNGAPVDVRAFVLKRDMPDQLAQIVSQMPGAISFVPLAVASGAAAPIQMLPIDGAQASSQALLNGTYTFWSVEHLYTVGDGTAQAQAYIQFASSSQELNVLSGFGEVPLSMIDPAILQTHLPGPQI